MRLVSAGMQPHSREVEPLHQHLIIDSTNEKSSRRHKKLTPLKDNVRPASGYKRQFVFRSTNTLGNKKYTNYYLIIWLSILAEKKSLIIHKLVDSKTAIKINKRRTYSIQSG